MGRLSDLHKNIIQSYNAEELKALCFDLDVPYDSLEGTTLPTRAAALLDYLDKRDELPKLVAYGSKAFPMRTWVLPPPGVGGLEQSTISRKLVLGMAALIVAIGAVIVVIVIQSNGALSNSPSTISLTTLPILTAVPTIMTAPIPTVLPSPTAGPKKMNGIFNIVVAPFSQLEEDGRLISSTEGLALSDWVYQQLKTNLKPEDALIWSETTPPNEKGVTLNIITGTTSEVRQDNARLLAKRIGAQMVIFGTLSGSGNDGKFEPEFYIDATASKYKGEAEEVIGGHKLGTPMAIERPMGAEAALMMKYSLNARAVFVRGLLFDLIGLHVEAYQNFSSIQAAWNAGEVEGAGKEVLPFFMAREIVFLLDRDMDLNLLGMTRSAALTKAETLILLSLSYNKDYSLAHLQLGNIYLARAEPVVARIVDSPAGPTPTITSTDYVQAKADVTSSVKEYQTALTLAQRSIDRYPVLLVKAQISLANAWRLQGVTQWMVEQQLTDAQGSLDRANQVLDQAFSANLTDKSRLMVTAQWIRGSIALAQAGVRFQLNDDVAFNVWVKIAHDTFELCAQQPDNADLTLKKIKEQCQEQLNQLKETTK